MNNVKIDRRGFIRVEGYKVARVVDGLLEFQVKRNSLARKATGKNNVYATPDAIQEAVDNYIPKEQAADTPVKKNGTQVINKTPSPLPLKTTIDPQPDVTAGSKA